MIYYSWSCNKARFWTIKSGKDDLILEEETFYFDNEKLMIKESFLDMNESKVFESRKLNSANLAPKAFTCPENNYRSLTKNRDFLKRRLKLLWIKVVRVVKFKPRHFKQPLLYRIPNFLNRFLCNGQATRLKLLQLVFLPHKSCRYFHRQMQV